jgi:O-antigen/teichoic acid export membrane protein
VRDTVRHLGKGVAIYGAGDAAINVVNVLLLAVYVKNDYLVLQDYGALAIIAAFEMVAKVVSRWGLDGAFMRFFHDRQTGGPLERLTSTIVWFTLAADAVVFGLLMAASAAIGARLFPHPTYVLAFRLMLLNTFLISLTFVPFHVMRLRNEAVTYSALVLRDQLAQSSRASGWSSACAGAWLAGTRPTWPSRSCCCRCSGGG